MYVKLLMQATIFYCYLFDALCNYMFTYFIIVYLICHVRYCLHIFFLTLPVSAYSVCIKLDWKR